MQKKRYVLYVSFPLRHDTVIDQTTALEKLIGREPTGMGAGFGMRDVDFEFDNKVDLLKRPAELIPFLDRLSKTREFAAVVPVSAHTGRNIPELLRVLREALPEGPAAYPEDQFTDRDERFLAAELLREKLFKDLGQELPYRCEVVIESFKEEGRLRRIEATILVERESQKLIVLGARGERLKRMASAARKDMERLFEGKVYLGVWVKVRRAWTDDARVLRQLGYE